MNQDQVPEYPQVKKFQSLVEKAKRAYLNYLMELGYVFEQTGSYENTAYWAIHPNYYLTQDEIWDSDKFIIDGRVSPEYFPIGAFIRIDSIAESETKDPWETSYFLYEDRCSLEYLC